VVRLCLSLRNRLALCNIVNHKSDTLANMLETNLPNISFRRDLNVPRLASWNSLLLHLARVHVTQGPNGFRWSLQENVELCKLNV
jgi:hypothetical protein